MVEYRWLYELSPVQRESVGELYVHVFAESLELMAPDLKKWAAYVARALRLDRTLVAMNERTAIGAISYSAPGHREALAARFGPLLRAFGIRAGSTTCVVMAYEFLAPLPFSTGQVPYIELLAVDERFRGLGHARALIGELVARLGYPAYSIQADDNNATALKLYDSMGFREVGRIDEPWPAARKAGTMERVFMQLDVTANETEGATRVQT